MLLAATSIFGQPQTNIPHTAHIPSLTPSDLKKGDLDIRVQERGGVALL